MTAFNIVEETYEPDYDTFEDIMIDIDEENGNSTILGTDTEPLVEGFETFWLNGTEYSLPMKYGEMDDIGFDLIDENEGLWFPPEYEETIFLTDDDGYDWLMVSVSNNTDEDLYLEDCVVDYIYVENPTVYDVFAEIPDFEFCDGITFDSGYNEVEAYLGTPYYYYENSSDDYYYEMFEWAYYGDDEMHFVSIDFYDGQMYSVTIEKKIYEE